MAMSHATAKAILAGRTTGKFNLTAQDLQEVPAELWDEKLPVTVQGTGSEAPNWWEISLPQRLELSRNSLTTLSEALGVWGENLTLLDVSHNLLQQLPAALSQLAQLGTLTANNNQLQALPTLPNSLVVVHLQDNALEQLPKCLAQCSRLTTLDISHNRINHMPAEVLHNCRGLVNLICNDNLIPELPATVGCLNRLQVLNLEQNQLIQVPAALGACTALLELHLGFNMLQSLPLELARCTALRHLSARDNAITDYPAQLCNLHLNCLDIQNCSLESLPPELGFMSSLRALRLQGNALKSVRSTLITGPVSTLLEYLKSRLPGEDLGQPTSAVTSGNVFGCDPHELAAEAAKKLTLNDQAARSQAQPPAAAAPRGASASAPFSNGHNHGSGAGGGGGVLAARPAQATPELLLANTGLVAVPQDVWAALGALTKLDLSGNKVTHIPPEAWVSASRLRSLSLAKLPLTQWPLPWRDPGCMPSLQTLSLAGCSQLRQVPDGALCCCAASLTSLDLSGVPGAGRLPPSTISSLTLLTHLDLTATGTTAFPAEVLTLHSTLRVLKLAGNKISSLPDQISCMTRLDELHLANNDMSGVPPTLGLLSGTLKTLTLEGNPLRTIRRPILEKGTSAVLAYLKDRLPVN